ncbi:MAG TPA: MmgE/PrpD family protein [Ktedonobacteraceae bacterium]|nr:MmgE/PrpD family protein [Ktedonobacteraceae bacterium]
MTETILQTLAHFAAKTREQGIDAALQQDVKRRVMDTLGICLAASMLEPATIVEQVIEDWGGSPRASIVGRQQQYPASSAALFNGTLAHALDFDDTHLPSVLHPSASVIPAALAVAEAAQSPGKDLLAAIAVGDELTVRIGMAGYNRELGNSVFFEKGLHATSIAGTLGAAAAAAMLYRLDEAEIGHAIAIAASMGAGIIEANRTGGTVKRIHCGWAAHAGIAAAELARSGLSGPPTVFEGRFGFLQAYLDEQADAQALTRKLGEEWELPRIFFKPYPTNHFTHAGIDAARILRAQGLDVADITDIELGVASAVLRTIAQPEAEKARPATGYAARFSGPFTVATALVGGGGLGVSASDFSDEAVHDPVKLELAARVRCVASEECDRIFPDQFPAILRVWLKDGSMHEARVLANRGGSENPLSDEELALKFAMNAGAVLPEAQIAALRDAIQSLDTVDTISGMMRLLQRS